MKKQFNNEIYYNVENSNLNVYVNQTKDKSILITDEEEILAFTNGKFILYNKDGTIQYEV